MTEFLEKKYFGIKFEGINHDNNNDKYRVLKSYSNVEYQEDEYNGIKCVNLTVELECINTKALIKQKWYWEDDYSGGKKTAKLLSQGVLKEGIPMIKSARKR